MPFDFERRRVSVLARARAAGALVVKGAPEDVLAVARAVTRSPAATEPLPLDAAARVAPRRSSTNLGAGGFRVLGVAWRECRPATAGRPGATNASLVFAGFVAFLDPPKAERRRGASRRWPRSGVAVKILTGDNERVTRHVCGELGIPVDGRPDRRRGRGAERRGARRAHRGRPTSSAG